MKKKVWSGSIRQLLMSILLGLLAIGMIFVLAKDLFWGSKEPTEEEIHQEFIILLVPIAQDAYKEYQVLPSISLSQAILESDWGQSELAYKYYNLYGMKSFGVEPSVSLETAEFVNNQWIRVEADFKVYPSWRASVEDHAALMVKGVAWNKNLYQGVLLAKDYQEAAYALQQAGYATDPDYAVKLIALIDRYHLNQYDHLPVEQKQ